MKNRARFTWQYAEAHRSEASKEHRRVHNRAVYLVLKLEVLAAYGDVCSCGSSENLEIDHIFNDGPAERALGLRGVVLYRHLKKLGFPRDRYQLLCASCNTRKAIGTFVRRGRYSKPLVAA